MARAIVTALSAVTVLYLAIHSLSYRSQTVQDAGLTNNSLEAFNVSQSVAADMTTIAGVALPRVFIVVLLVLLAGLFLVLTRS